MGDIVLFVHSPAEKMVLDPGDNWTQSRHYPTGMYREIWDHRGGEGKKDR